MGDGKPNVMFVLGGPGAGKGTQCARLVFSKHANHPNYFKSVLWLPNQDSWEIWPCTSFCGRSAESREGLPWLPGTHLNKILFGCQPILTFTGSCQIKFNILMMPHILIVWGADRTSHHQWDHCACGHHMQVNIWLMVISSQFMFSPETVWLRGQWKKATRMSSWSTASPGTTQIHTAPALYNIHSL